MGASTLIDSMGVPFRIVRNGECIGTCIGLPRTHGSDYITFKPAADVQTGDVAIDPANQSYTVTHTKIEFFGGAPNMLLAYCETEYDRAERKRQSSTVIQVTNAYGSFIGVNNVATIQYSAALADLKEKAEAYAGPDREQMDRLISLVEMMAKDEIPMQKGMLAKFSALMEKHSWLSGSVASALLSILLNNLHLG